jgi:hypothetical protein
LRITKDELQYLLTGLLSTDSEFEERPNPNPQIFSAKMWHQICEISSLEHFEAIVDDIEKNPV